MLLLCCKVIMWPQKRRDSKRRMKKKMVLLPQELIIQILLRLPVKSLVRFKCVSKSWLSLISDPHFAKSHFELAATPTHRLLLLGQSLYEARSIDLNASLHDDSASAALNLNFSISQYDKIIGSCRGFLLIACNPNLYVWNPSTGAHKRIPSSPVESNLEAMIFTFIYGFGYDPSTDDYLVVQAYYEPNADLATHVELFSFKANTWTEMEGTHLSHMNASDDLRLGSLLNGAIHWLAYRYDASENVILAFDLMERRFSDISLPVDFEYDLNFCDLWVLDGFLSLWVMEEDATVIWVMEEYKVQSSWTRTIVVSINAIPTQYFSPICYSKSGDIIGIDGSTGLVKCNDRGQLLEHCTFGDNVHGRDVAMYTESLLPLPGESEHQD
ncbi:F-box/kelch-repeat protein At3g23880-like [Abrus precatorius]|uniref:F-box/kelch-repeat protein At3g23880-like n=1 Tax=Abrus precatorius TaxID=3816 RepID=A0A8B8JKX1_ABRPR|nr:F-box/kelch-repeat protein At3g23880-like [Abrus precatorius]